MNVMMNKTAFALVLSLGLVAGCSTTGDEPMGDDEMTAVDQDGGASVYGGDDDGGISSDELRERQRRQAEQEGSQGDAALRRITTFYFDFDTSEIKAESRDVLAAHARYLSNNPNVNVRLEGHTDERGSKEYNMALGERRANSVQRFMVVNGADRSQIETVSYGEEKPAAMGSGESAWAQNRRVELIFQ